MAIRTTVKRANRKQSSGILGVVIISASIIGAALIIGRGSSRGQPPPVEQAPIVAAFDTVQIMVPAEPVAAGTRISDIRFKTVSYPRHQVPVSAVTDIATVLSSVTSTALPANVPLFRENISSSNTAVNPVIEQIPPGMRAMTINVDATSAVEGWAGSGSLVDVLLIDKNRTTVVAERVKILSAERSVSPVDGRGSPNVPRTVTLLVTQEQCLAINTAIPLGKIAFALRSNRDDANWADGQYTADQLKGGAAKTADISGYIAVKDSKDGAGAFALSNGKWVRTDVVPEGFLVNGARQVHEKDKP